MEYEYKCTECGTTWGISNSPECNCGVEVEEVEVKETTETSSVPLDLIVRPLKYAVEQRLRFIDFLLHQYGHINRSAVIDFFGVGPATATRDFAAYKKLAPLNTVFNGTDKNYYCTTDFKQIFA